jgi:hypothetical protein
VIYIDDGMTRRGTYSLCKGYYNQEIHTRWIRIGAWWGYMGDGWGNRRNQMCANWNNLTEHQGADGEGYHSQEFL